ncbi:MAG TPA: acyltransferase, partial [Turneriella sp.]|nr:acyltransferase [Turneriella sp.]
QILTGTADYHLYFLVILAQCYLLFPFLLKFRHSYGKTYLWSTWTIFAAIVFLLYKGTSEWVLPRLGLTHPAWHASFVVYWLPYFMLGILHGTMPMEAKPYRRSLFVLAFLLCAAALALVFVEYDSYSRLGTPVDYYNHFSRPTVVLYTLAIIGLLFALPRSVETKGGHGERLAALTFAVYLIHPQVLRIVTPSMLFLPSLVAIATFVLVYIFTALIKKASNANNPALLRKTAGLLQRCLGLR